MFEKATHKHAVGYMLQFFLGAKLICKFFCPSLTCLQTGSLTFLPYVIHNDDIQNIWFVIKAFQCSCLNLIYGSVEIWGSF